MPTFVPTRLWAAHTSTSNPLQTSGGPQSYIDLSLPTLELLARSSARVKDSIATSAHNKHLTSTTRRTLTLRPDLPAFVLELLQRSVMKSLAWLFKHPAAKLIRPCDGGAASIDHQEHGDVACVLYTIPIYNTALAKLSTRVAREVVEAETLGRRMRGLQIVKHGRLHADEKRPSMPDPAPVQNVAAVYPAYEYPVVQDGRGRAVPVYGLWEMLGAERVAELVGGTKFEGVGCVVLGEGGRGVKAQMGLLKLRNYLSRG
jgi:hypothetical protein